MTLLSVSSITTYCFPCWLPYEGLQFPWILFDLITNWESFFLRWCSRGLGASCLEPAAPALLVGSADAAMLLASAAAELSLALWPIPRRTYWLKFLTLFMFLADCLAFSVMLELCSRRLTFFAWFAPLDPLVHVLYVGWAGLLWFCKLCRFSKFRSWGTIGLLCLLLEVGCASRPWIPFLLSPYLASSKLRSRCRHGGHHGGRF